MTPEHKITADHTPNMTRLSRARCFGGWQEIWQHDSAETRTPMKLSVYLPPAAAEQRCPVVYWLSGLTCTEENFTFKAGAQRYAAELGLILVAPDTSPRGANLPGEDESWDFGSGAGFYIDASAEPWARHYRMESYVAKELPALIKAHFPVNGRNAIAGHSMGGHGALTLALKYPQQYVSASAFAPIAAPTLCPWGHKAFSNYLGPDQTTWAAHDAHLLIQQSQFQQNPTKIPMLVDQGSEDGFLREQLMPQLLEQAATAADYPLSLSYREGYDHSYYFIASFIGEHLHWHSQHLSKKGDT